MTPTSIRYSATESRLSFNAGTRALHVHEVFASSPRTVQAGEGTDLIGIFTCLLPDETLWEFTDAKTGTLLGHLTRQPNDPVYTDRWTFTNPHTGAQRLIVLPMTVVGLLAACANAVASLN
jgi:hypothetical protein